MKTIHTQICPFCGVEAEYQLVDHNNAKHFRCGTCTEFQISMEAEKRLGQSPRWRPEYSAKAKQAPDGFALVITVPSTPKREGIANPAIVGEYVSYPDLSK